MESKLAVSSIAWQHSQEDDAAKKLLELDVKCVEIAPTKIWPEKIAKDPLSVTQEEIDEAIGFWKNKGIAPVAMQSMLFLRPELKIFEPETTEETVTYLEKFIELSARLGVERMVFGSPKNRHINEALSKEDHDELARQIFTRIAAKAVDNNVVFCIEPNPEAYACNFVVNAKQGRDLVKIVNSIGFGLHLDAAGMTLAGDDVVSEITQSADVLQHFHISEPYLNPVANDELVKHGVIAGALKAIRYDKTVSIEMKPSDSDDQNIVNIHNAVVLAKKFYTVS